MRVSDPEYLQHAAFGELDRFSRFYEQLADGVFQFASMGTTAICNIDTYVYTGIAGTLNSISTVLRAGQINDGYALLRKYYDSAIINVYSNLYLRDHFNTVKLTAESLIVRQVNDWLHGKARLPEYRVMSRYIRSSERLEEINGLLYADDFYKQVRDRCNDHAHYNFFANVLLNNNKVHLSHRGRTLDQLMFDMRGIFILHLAYVFSINDHYMMSGDHMDYLECGELPPEESQYWVAPYVQDVFDSVLSLHKPAVADAIRRGSRMQLAC